MGLLAILALLLLVTKSSLETSSNLENDPVQPVVSLKIQKREAVPVKAKDLDDLAQEFIEEKLVEHGQVLEHLVELVQKNEELTRQLVTKLGSNKSVEKPELPEKVEVLKSRRRNLEKDSVEDKVADNPFVRLGKNLPKYGMLIKDLVMGHDRSADPIPLVDQNPVSNFQKRSKI